MHSVLKSFTISALLIANLALAEAKCVFCDIVNHNAPASIVAENNDVLVFKSIHQRYPSHWLIIPKPHVLDIKSMTNEQLMGKVFMAASDLGKQLDGDQSFNLQVNNGASAGQTVFHFHVHFTSQNKLRTSNPKI